MFVICVYTVFYREVLKALTKTRTLYERWRTGDDGAELRYRINGFCFGQCRVLFPK